MDRYINLIAPNISAPHFKSDEMVGNEISYRVVSD